jgi:bacteriocin-like protein
MADHDAKKVEETEVPQESEVTELDDKNLEEVSGGTVINNCNC